MPMLHRRTVLAAGLGLTLGGRATAQVVETYSETTTERDAPLDAWVDAWGRPTAKVTINGAGPYDFLVDTGANTSVVAMRHVQALGAPLVGMTIVNGTTGSAELPMARIASLSTGAVKSANIEVAVLPDKALLRQDGILGGDVFAGKRLFFDIANKRVVVEAPRRRPSRALIAGNLTVRNGALAEIEGRVGRVTARLMLDTGGDGCIVNSKLAEALIKTHPRMLRFDRGTVQGVTGHVLAGDLLALPDITMDTVTVAKVGAVAVDAPIFDLWGLSNSRAMIVGVSVLSRAQSFTIDYGARRFEAVPMAAMAAQRENPLA